jgi:GNAT superfamily N-acetyltransferase
MNHDARIRIIYPREAGALDQVRQLIRAFVSWHRKRHLEDIELINEYFDTVAFENELANLPGKYTGPEGSLLLAFYDNQPAGCVALRKIDATSCEMKRMFVYEEFHGKGIGQILADAIIKEAKDLGYAYMKLDTSFRQTEAIRLYQKAGFRKTGPYYDLPVKMRNWLVFLELDLRETTGK